MSLEVFSLLDWSLSVVTSLSKSSTTEGGTLSAPGVVGVGGSMVVRGTGDGGGLSSSRQLVSTPDSSRTLRNSVKEVTDLSSSLECSETCSSAGGKSCSSTDKDVAGAEDNSFNNSSSVILSFSLQLLSSTGSSERLRGVLIPDFRLSKRSFSALSASKIVPPVTYSNSK